MRYGIFFRLIMLISAVLFVGDALWAQDQTGWEPAATAVVASEPALSGHVDGQVHFAAVTAAGEVVTATTESPGNWTDQSVLDDLLSGGSAFRADPGTAPEILRNGETLHLFVRGQDNNLYRADKLRTDKWTRWRRMTSGGQIAGRIAVALTMSGAGQEEFHVVHRASAGVGYLRYSENHLVGQSTWVDVDAGIIGSDREHEVLVLLQTREGRLIAEKTGAPWPGLWARVYQDVAEGRDSEYVDLGQVVHFNGRFFASYTERTRLAQFDREYRDVVKALEPEAGWISTVSDTFKPGRPVPKSALAVYRNRLVSAHTDDTGAVRYSHLDSARASPVWAGFNGPFYPVGDILVEDGAVENPAFLPIDPDTVTSLRPALAPFDRRERDGTTYVHGAPDYGGNEFGEDLFAALTQRGNGRLRFINFSRAIFEKEAGYSYVLYLDQGAPGVSQSHPQAPTLIGDPGSDGRPFLTELGYVGWMLPFDFIDRALREASVRACDDGHGSGRFPAPCDAARYPIIMLPAGRSFIGGGSWINHAALAEGNVVHEILHAMLTHYWGLGSTSPGAVFATRTGLPVSVLDEAHAAFGKDVNGECEINTKDDTCPEKSAGRQPGFPLDTASNNYHMTDRQHSFIWALITYIQDGTALRLWVQDDLDAGEDLLERKYNWIRDHVFDGVEFTTDGARL